MLTSERCFIISVADKSLNLIILLSMVLSFFSMVPSFSPTSIRVLSSSSVIRCSRGFMIFSTSHTAPCDNRSKRNTTGKNIFSSANKVTALERHFFSGFRPAIVFGIICPKVVITKAVARVGSPTPPPPQSFTTRAVANAEIRAFKKFVPIKTVVKSRGILDFNFATVFAPLFPSSCMRRSFTFVKEI